MTLIARSVFNILFIASLEAALGKDFGLSEVPGFAGSGLYQIHIAGANRMAFDFADCGLRRLSAPAHFWMAGKFNRPEYSWFRYSELTDPARDGGVLDLLWYDPRGSAYDPARLPLDKHFREADCVTMRGSWKDPDAIALAIQGGRTTTSRDTGTSTSDRSFSMPSGNGGSWIPGWRAKPTSRTRTTFRGRTFTVSARRDTTPW